MLDNKPLAVSQICWVSFCFHRDYVYHNLADSLYFSNSLLAYQGLGLYDTKIGLILVNLSFGLSFAIYFLFAYFQTIPRELDDAAHIDGCTWLGIFWYVILPIARPAVVTTFLIGYIGVWNEYLLANILTASENAKTLTVRILEIAPAARIEPYQLYAVGGIMSLIPVILIVMLGQRHIVGGIVRGAVKG